MARAKAAQDYMAARNALVQRLDELQNELNDIREALGAGAAPRASAAKSAAGNVAAPSAGRKRGKKRMPRGQGLLLILQALQEHGPIMPREIANVTGITSGTVSNTLNTLKQKKHATHTDKGWALSAAGKAELKARS